VKAIALLSIILVLLAAGCVQEEAAPAPTEQPIGGERDEHGCLGPAGYSWNSDIGACLREWEVPEGAQRTAAAAAAESLGNEEGLTLTRVDENSCSECYTVHFALEGEQIEVKVSAGEAVDEFPAAPSGIDEHGCDLGAGYEWCGVLDKCTKSGECVAPTPTPEPETQYTYLSLEEKWCNANNLVLLLKNTGCCRTGKPVARVYQVAGGENIKPCLEFEFPREITRNGQQEFTLMNSKYGIEECDYTSGNYRMVPVSGEVLFNNVEIKCAG